MSGNYRGGTRSIAFAREWKKKQKRSLDVRHDERIGSILSTFFNIRSFFFSFFFFIIRTESSPKNCIPIVNRFERSPSLSLSLSNRVHGASIVKTSRLATKALKHGGRLSVESRDRSTIARELLVRIKLRTKRLLIKTFKQYLSSSYYSRSAFHATSAVLLLLSLLRLPKQ